MKYKEIQINVKKCPHLGYLETCTKRNCISCWQVDKNCEFKEKQVRKEIK